MVEVHHDGPSGLAAAEHDDYDVIVLDQMLPGGMDGVQICETLRRAQQHNANSLVDSQRRRFVTVWLGSMPGPVIT